MTTAPASPYDENLLAQAPEVTKADLQDGYNPDLLREPTVKRTSTTRAAPSPPLRSNSDLHYHAIDKDLESSATPLQPKETPFEERRKPFWRTKKGIILIAIVGLAAIILAAVLGGVLGSRNQKHKDPSKDTNGEGSQSAGDNGQGASSSTVSVASGSRTSSFEAPNATDSARASSTGATQPIASGIPGSSGQAETGADSGQDGVASGTGTVGGPASMAAPAEGNGPTVNSPSNGDTSTPALLLRELGLHI